MRSKGAFTFIELLVVLAIIGLLLAVIIPTIDRGDPVPSVACKSYLRQIAVGAYLYLKDDEQLPPRDTWTDTLQKYMVVTEYFRCPRAPKEVRCSYAMNQYLPEITDPNQLPQDLVLFFEIEDGWNVSGGPELVYFGNHNGVANIVFTDGHVESVMADKLDSLRWKPE